MSREKQLFTLEQTLASLDFFIDEYFFRHNLWLSATENCELNGQEKTIIRERSVNLYQFVHMLHPYVYHKHFDLNGTDFRHDPDWAYPFMDEPESLTVSVMQLYGFWITFLGNSFFGNPFNEDNAKPLNNLVIDAYLRFRIDFGWDGAFALHCADQNSNTADIEDHSPSLFTYGELSHLTGLSNSTLRGKITNNTTSDVNIQTHSKVGEVFTRKSVKADGKKAIEPYGFEIPESLQSFFEGKIGGGIKTLFEHREIVPFLAINGAYQPTKFLPPQHEPFPPYDDSAKIHAAVTRWLGQHPKTARVEQLLHFIQATGIDINGQNTFWEAMKAGKARLSLGTLASINSYMASVEGGSPSDNPWQPLWNAYRQL